MLIDYVKADDFFAELAIDAEDARILERTVRYRLDEVDEQKEGLSQSVGVWITYVRCDAKGLPMSLNSLGLLCGSTADKDCDAIAIGEEIHNRLLDMAEEIGFEVRLGKIEML